MPPLIVEQTFRDDGIAQRQRDGADAMRRFQNQQARLHVISSFDTISWSPWSVCDSIDQQPTNDGRYEVFMSDTWTIYTDGGSRGNPGPAAYAYVIKRPGQADIEVKCYLGSTTNNIAEYTGMLKALEHAKQLGGKKLLLNSDSELMVKQMNGVYKVKNEGLLPLFRQATLLRKQFDNITFKHIYRDQNSHADALCNEAMDDRSPLPDEIELEIGQAKPAPAKPAAKTSDAPLAPTAVGESVTPMMQALDLLKQSAAKWAKSGDPTNPAPVEVLNRICDIMEADE